MEVGLGSMLNLVLHFGKFELRFSDKLYSSKRKRNGLLDHCLSVGKL